MRKTTLSIVLILYSHNTVTASSTVLRHFAEKQNTFYLPLPDRRCLACLARGFPDPALHFVRDCPVFYEVRGGFLASSLRRVRCSLLLPSLLLGIRLVWPPAFISSCPCTTPTRSTWPCSAAWGPRTSLDALSPPPVVPLPFPPQPRPQPPPPPPIPP